jgi:hypothetical protein
MSHYRPPHAWSALAGGFVFLLYAATLAPSTGFWDASEYIATAHIVGIPHPPGNPLFVILARVWIVLLAPLGLPVAVRVNLFAAATTAVAMSFFFLIAHRVVSELIEDRWPRLVGAFCAALVGGTAFTVWSQSTVNEKVYTVSVLIIAAASWLVIRSRDHEDPRRGARSLLAAGYLLVLGASNHLMSVLPGPAIVVFLAVSGAALLRSASFWMRAAVLILVGMSFNLVLPIRAAQEPVINEADPACESLGSAVVAVYTQGRSGCIPLSDVLTRQQYAKPPLSERQAPLTAQLLNYVQYFDWQWGRGLHAAETPGGARTWMTLLFTALGMAGLWSVWRADRAIFAYLVTLLATLTIALVYYLNFKFGYSINPEVEDRLLHEVRERDYFFVASFALWGVLAGIGLTGVWSYLSEKLGGGRGYLLAAPILLIAALPLALNVRWADRSGDFAARDWAYDLLMSVEPYAVLFTNGDNDTFPLWYLQEVEGIRRDVTVVVVQYLYTDWYPRQLQQLTRPEAQRSFVSPVPGLYDEPERVPERPIILTDPDVMDGVLAGSFAEDFTVPLPRVAIAYPAGTYLDRAQQLALAIIHDSIDERPVYFASTTGFMDGLGLQDWGVRHGLASKLLPRAPDDPPLPGVVQVDERYGGEWFDVERTRILVREVYSYRGLADRDVWADRSTLNIPWHYYVLHVQLADAALEAGESEQGEVVQGLLEAAEGFLLTARGGRLGTPGG